PLSYWGELAESAAVVVIDDETRP
ncbi:MAG: hypothetical protein QOJ95_1052, partial [Mycobacterium sp.]|nr:hypothetical protein [Mycobacterium sp.]